MLAAALTLFAFGCLTGVTTVLFGFGGGFVTVPVVFGVASASGAAGAMHIAVATSTAVMIVNATSATVASARSGRLRTEYLFPIAAYIAVGAALGAAGANLVPDTTLSILFAVYLAVTIIDSTARRGFFTGIDRDTATPKPLSRTTTTIGGLGIGTIASLLGVGGSVMTVPLLRRRNLPMTDAAALANPLSIPIALAGTAVYALTAPTATSPGRIGYVDLIAAAALLCGSLPTIAITKRFVTHIPDRIHAITYLTFLVIVLLSTIATALTS